MKRHFTLLHFICFSLLLFSSSCVSDQVDIHFDMTFSELVYSIEPIGEPETEKIIVNQVFESGLEEALQLNNSDINHLRSVHVNNITFLLDGNDEFSFDDFAKIDVFLERNNGSVSTLIATTDIINEGLAFTHLEIFNQDLSSFFAVGDPVIKMKAITKERINIPFEIEADVSFKVAATIEE